MFCLPMRVQTGEQTEISKVSDRWIGRPVWPVKRGVAQQFGHYGRWTRNFIRNSGQKTWKKSLVFITKRARSVSFYDLRNKMSTEGVGGCTAPLTSPAGPRSFRGKQFLNKKKVKSPVWSSPVNDHHQMANLL